MSELVEIEPVVNSPSDANSWAARTRKVGNSYADREQKKAFLANALLSNVSHVFTSSMLPKRDDACWTYCILVRILSHCFLGLTETALSHLGRGSPLGSDL